MRLLHLLLILVPVLGCQSKETSEVGVTTAPADSLALEETIDSANNVRQDGTVTSTGAPQDVKQQLPPELEVYLDQTHSLWQLPKLPEKDLASVSQEHQGPYFLQTDLNEDNRIDYVVQLAEHGFAMVRALIRPKAEDQPWQETVIDKKALVKVEGVLYSPFYLSLLEERKDALGKLPNDKTYKKGIIINEGSVATLHQWQTGGWRRTVLPKKTNTP